MIDCPNCGKPFTPTYERKKYCSHPCYLAHKSKRKRKMEARPCPQCGRVFTPTSKHPNVKYCSHRCGMASTKKIRDTTTCPQCGKAFELIPGEKSKFCSAKCSNRYNQAKDPDKWAVFICETCSKPFKDYAYRKTRFCSRRCGNQWKAKQPKPKARRLGWLDRRKGWRGSNWDTVREQVAKRDKYTCRVCGRKRTIINRWFDAHHIIPFNNFDSWEEANRLTNLIYLCRKCHRNAELGKIAIQPYLL